jgi:hypothetical protein
MKRLSADLDQHLTRDLKGFTDRMQYDTGQLAAVDSRLRRLPTAIANTHQRWRLVLEVKQWGWRSQAWRPGVTSCLP